MRTKPISAVYKITSIKEPNKFYIGATVNINKRWSMHLSTLRSGYHSNYYLREHVAAHGIDDLIFDILRKCYPCQLTKTENHFIRTMRPYFNDKNKDGKYIRNEI